MTRDEHVDRVERSWRELDEVVTGLEPEAVRRVTTGGWTVQDHLAHVAGWEESLLALLEGGNRAAAMGLPGMDDARVDTINAALHERHHQDPPEQVVAQLRDTHRRLLEKLRELSDEDLSRPYSYFQPGADDEDHLRPVSDWIAGNTWEHYAEHLDYIRPVLP